MEKFEIPHADNYVGRHIPKNLHKEVEAWFNDYWKEHGVEEIKGLELVKTPRHKEIIEIASRAVDVYLAQFGRKKVIDVPLEKIHLLRTGGTEEYSEGHILTGAHSSVYGSVLVDEASSELQTVIQIFHELYHAKSYHVLQTTGRHGEKGDIQPYHSGFRVVSRDGKQKFFDDIDEAVTTYMERKFYNDVLENHPSFQEEISSGVTPEFSRSRELRDLNDLVNNLYEQNKSEFENKEKVMNIFLEAQVTGHLLKIGRLVEKTYGKGSFRELGKLTGEAQK